MQNARDGLSHGVSGHSLRDRAGGGTGDKMVSHSRLPRDARANLIGIPAKQARPSTSRASASCASTTENRSPTTDVGDAFGMMRQLGALPASRPPPRRVTARMSNSGNAGSTAGTDHCDRRHTIASTRSPTTLGPQPCPHYDAAAVILRPGSLPVFMKKPSVIDGSGGPSHGARVAKVVAHQHARRRDAGRRRLLPWRSRPMPRLATAIRR